MWWPVLTELVLTQSAAYSTLRCLLLLELLHEMKILLLLLIYQPAQLPNAQMCFYVL